jgi:hypothetical protein
MPFIICCARIPKSTISSALFLEQHAFVTAPARQIAVELMSEPSPPAEISRTEPPLWSIGLAVIVILGAPLVLYSFAPTGPVREGDTVFSDGQQRAEVTRPAGLPVQLSDICLLDPNSPLIVIRVQNDQPDGSIVAQVQGSPAGEWPFCPPHAEVLLKGNQIFQKPAVFSGVREMLARLSGR